MNPNQSVDQGKMSIVKLSAGEFWVELVLSLGNQFVGGNVVALAPHAKVAIEAVDELALSYREANWLGGVASGALYAFRALRIPRQHVEVIQLSGRLRASDMSVIANGSAIAIAELAGKELTGLSTEGWTVATKLADPIPSIRGQRDIPSHELQRMSTRSLLAILAFDKWEPQLSTTTLQRIHDLAAERVDAGDNEAEKLLAGSAQLE